VPFVIRVVAFARPSEKMELTNREAGESGEVTGHLDPFEKGVDLADDAGGLAAAEF
jgi:hypothetical protein